MDLIHHLLYGYWQQNGDPRSSQYILSKYGFYLPLTIIGLYFTFVVQLGPALMAKRQACGLRRTLILYNSFMVVSNLYFFCHCLRTYRYGLDCFDFDYPRTDDLSTNELFKIEILNFYLLSKFLDLFDTCFFVLRKKQTQVTKLHLYHHSVVPILVWIVFRVIPTSNPVAVFGLANSFIHVLMYSYYALAALGDSIRPYLWWKKYLTMLQIYQFVLYSIFAGLFGYYQRGYPAYLQMLAYTQPVIFLVLFCRFYWSSYGGKRHINSKLKSMCHTTTLLEDHHLYTTNKVKNH